MLATMLCCPITMACTRNLQTCGNLLWNALKKVRRIRCTDASRFGSNVFYCGRNISCSFQKSVRAPASHHKSPFFGTPEISLDDLTHHMLISKTCDALSKANAEPGEMIDERLLCEKLLQRRMFREAALLARHSVGCDTAMVFKGFTEW